MKEYNSAIKKLKKEKVFSKIIAKAQPIDQPGSGNVFNELVKNIAYQQVSYKAAESVYKKFILLIGKKNYKPSDVLKLNYEELKSVGLSYRKTDYIINIAEFFKENKLHRFEWSTLTDQEITGLLTQIKGVGIWTVRMILIFELNRPDVFPSGDLAIQYVIKDQYQLKEEKKELIKKIEQISLKWQPYRTLASLYLWGYRRLQINKEI